jgi:hypothetical protein
MSKTQRPIVLIHDVSTGEVIEREMNDVELAQYELDNETKLANQLIAEEKNAAKNALLEKLGITADEAKLLLE